MRSVNEIVKSFIEKYSNQNLTTPAQMISLQADVQAIQAELVRAISNRLIDESVDESRDANHRTVMRHAATLVRTVLTGQTLTAETPVECQHEVNPLAPVVRSSPPGYWCMKCNQIFEKPQEQRAQPATLENLHAVPFTDEEFDAFREKRGWNMATRDEVARLTATALLYKQEMIAAKKQLEEFREYANKLTQRPPGRGHTGRYGAQGQVGAVVDELGIGPPPAGWPTR